MFGSLKNILVPLCLGGLLSVPAYPQGTVEDYNRAYNLREKYSAKHVLYSNVVPHWVEDTDVFWYIRNTARGKEYIKVDAKQSKRSALFDQKKLASQLAEQTGKQTDACNLPLNQCRLNPKADTLRFESAGKYWAYAIKKNSLVTEGEVQPRGPQPHWMEVDDEKGRGPVTSPDGKYTAYIKNDNIYVRDVASGKEKQLSIDGTKGNYYSSYIQWSPDSKALAACRIRPAEKRYVYYVESSPADQLQPKLHKQEYAKPGDELRFKVPCIFEMESGRRLIPSTELFSQQYDL